MSNHLERMACPHGHRLKVTSIDLDGWKTERGHLESGELCPRCGADGWSSIPFKDGQDPRAQGTYPNPT